MSEKSHIPNSYTQYCHFVRLPYSQSSQLLPQWSPSFPMIVFFLAQPHCFCSVLLQGLGEYATVAGESACTFVFFTGASQGGGGISSTAQHADHRLRRTNMNLCGPGGGRSPEEPMLTAVFVHMFWVSEIFELSMFVQSVLELTKLFTIMQKKKKNTFVKSLSLQCNIRRHMFSFWWYVCFDLE